MRRTFTELARRAWCRARRLPRGRGAPTPADSVRLPFRGRPGCRSPSARAPHPRERRAPEGPRAPPRSTARRLQRCSARAVAPPGPGGRQEEEEGQEDPGRRAPSQRPARGPASGPAHLRPGRQERGPERQVSQKFPCVRCHGGRHLKQETRRGERASETAGGREGGEEAGPGGPRARPRARAGSGGTRLCPRGEHLAAVPGPVLCPRALREPPSPGPTLAPSSPLAFRGPLGFSLYYSGILLFWSKNKHRALCSRGSN